MTHSSPLPELIDPGKLPSYAAPPLVHFADQDAEELKIPLSQYLWILKRHRWKILSFIAAAVIATWIVSGRMTPIFEAIATVDVDRQTPTGVVGQDSTRTSLTDADQFMATQIKLIESDEVLRPVAVNFNLREPHREADAGRDNDAPVILRNLRVTRPPNTYLIEIGYRSGDPRLAASVANAVAESYLKHTFTIHLGSSASQSKFMEHELEDLKAKMEISTQALAAFDPNLISPEEKTNILASRLVQLNTDYTMAQGERLKQQAAYDSVAEGSLDAALATPQGDELRKLADRLSEAREHFAEDRAYYGAKNPEYLREEAHLKEIQASFDAARASLIGRVQAGFREAEQRETMAKQAVADAKAEFDQVNAGAFRYQALKREADGDKSLYEELLRKVKEAGINAGFQNSGIRIAGAARPALEPVYPDIRLNLLLALLFSTLVAVSAAVVADLLDQTIRDPEQVARMLHTEVIGSLPLMKTRPGTGFNSGGLAAERGAAGLRDGSSRGDDEHDLSGFNESVRTLLNSMLLSCFDRPYRSLLITSAAPGEGKTTTAANLAAAHAERGKRTLLIDGDLRRPSVHRNFNLPCVVGLSNVLMGEIPWHGACIGVEGLPSLDILPAGPPSRRAAEMVGRGLTELLEEASSEYDLVILDAPPLLGFAEPLQMAAAADGVLIVARAGETSRKAVAGVLATLKRLRAKVVGIVLNEVHKELSESYYYYGNYRSYYK